MPKRFQNPIEVPLEVLEGLEAVRASGVANMRDCAAIQAAAARLGYPETVLWLEWNKRRYSEGVFRGFVAER
jgi:hypothetical protein